MRKILLAAGVATAAALTLTGCGITSGTITQKVHTESYDYPMSMCVSYNTNGLCASTMIVMETAPATYCVHLKNEAGKTGTQCTTEQEWDKMKVGEQITFTKG